MWGCLTLLLFLLTSRIEEGDIEGQPIKGPEVETEGSEAEAGEGGGDQGMWNMGNLGTVLHKTLLKLLKSCPVCTKPCQYLEVL